jgi:hypothetical protein
MQLIFNKKQYEIPDTIDLLNPAEISWINTLFANMTEVHKHPKDVWKAVYEDIFVNNPNLTEAHKYAICVVFSSNVTEAFLRDEFNETMANFANMINTIQQSESVLTTPESPRLILP